MLPKNVVLLVIVTLQLIQLSLLITCVCSRPHLPQLFTVSAFPLGFSLTGIGLFTPFPNPAHPQHTLLQTSLHSGLCSHLHCSNPGDTTLLTEAYNPPSPHVTAGQLLLWGRATSTRPREVCSWSPKSGLKVSVSSYLLNSMFISQSCYLYH